MHKFDKVINPNVHHEINFKQEKFHNLLKKNDNEGGKRNV